PLLSFWAKYVLVICFKWWSSERSVATRRMAARANHEPHEQIVVWFAWLVLMAFDVKRWNLSHMPEVLTYAGAVLIPIGFIIVWLTFRENSFAAPVVKIQNERGQRVISTGPYRIVRHPMYAGGLLYMIGMPLLLGSWLGLLVLPLIVGALSMRIFIEEATLRKGLPGHGDYATRVRYKLIPGVW